MGMGMGEKFRVTLFGESHGKCVGALVEGIPPGTPLDAESLARDLSLRKPGRKGMSSRRELDDCEIVSGIHEGKATGWPVLMLARNEDAKPSDYGFLPDHPRPGHADMVEAIRSDGNYDPRGGGSQSARLTLGLVAAGSQARTLLDEAGWTCKAHLHSIGQIFSRPLKELDYSTDFSEGSAMARLNCHDPDVVGQMSELLESVRMDRDTIGSSVELIVDGLPIGVGEPWFDGIEPSLARGLMAIPGARAVEFSHGTDSSLMRGSEHNDMWIPGEDSPILEGADSGDADGSLGGRSTGAPIRAIVHFKPPSSLPREQFTLHLPSNEVRSLKVGGRHDPVIGPRAAPVVEAVAMLVICDLGMLGGYLGNQD
ncbi:MAG: chorismate synthase [Euryarchaeota archaeon]|nr:chorismate synthase [Euryarchaeota archaeon]|tara:strand:+ start:1413 stop:2519 length:1107 start_codon:yes stop_codon:yes gene_type:complete